MARPPLTDRQRAGLEMGAQYRFKKGEPARNPGGRPKKIYEVEKLAQKHAKRAIEVMVELLEDDNPKVRLHAASVLLDRGFGKPRQRTDTNVDVTIDVAQQHLEALRAISNRTSPDGTPARAHPVIDVTPEASADFLPKRSPEMAPIAVKPDTGG